MKLDVIGQSGGRILQLQGDNVGQARWSIDVQVCRAAIQVQGGDQPHETIIVISVKVGDQDVVDSGKFDFVALDLQLGAFPTIDHKVFILYPQ